MSSSLPLGSTSWCEGSVLLVLKCAFWGCGSKTVRYRDCTSRQKHSASGVARGDRQSGSTLRLFRSLVRRRVVSSSGDLNRGDTPTLMSGCRRNARDVRFEGQNGHWLGERVMSAAVIDRIEI